ncbi:hypothetical protein JCM3770_004304 [Rhodotorula araucariae]
MTPSLPAVETLVFAVLVCAVSVLALGLVAESQLLAFPRALGTAPRPDLFTSKRSLPLVGDLVDILRNINRMPERKCSLAYNRRRPLTATFARFPGTVEHYVERQEAGMAASGMALTFTLPGKGRYIFLERPEHLEYMQRTHFENFEKGELQRVPMGQLFGSGIFVSDGTAWQVHRKTSSKLFTNATYRGIISTSTHRSTAQLLEVIDHLAARGDDVNISQLFFALTLDAFAFMAFSTDPGSLLGQKEHKVHPFAAALDYVQTQTQKRLQSPLWPLTEVFTGTASKMRASMATVHAFADEIIDARLAQVEAQAEPHAGEVGPEGDDLLGLYMRGKGPDGERMSREQLRDAITNLLLAGRDTTASTLSWATFQLLAHPEYIARIRAEAATLDDPTRLAFDRMKEMHWTHAVFEETVRLHPVVPNNHWTALGDDQIPNGPRIEKGDLVAWCDFLQARDPSIWGADAGAWKPERWLDDDGRFKMDGRLHAFNGGYRRCLGETLATFESLAVLLALFSTFDLAFAPGYLESTPMIQTPLCAEKTPMYRHSLTMPMAHPLRVVATRRAAE